MSLNASQPKISLPLEMFGVILVLLFALGLRLFALTSESAWCDEVVTAVHLPAPSLAQFLGEAFTTDKVLAPWPAYHMLEYVWSTLFGATLPALRSLSILLNLLMLLLLYLRARLFLDPGAALFTLTLATLSLSQIYYAQDIRFYAWIGFAVLVCEGSLAWALRQQAPMAWAIHLVASAALLLSHAFVLLLFPILFLHILLRRGFHSRTARSWAVAQGLLLLGFIAWRILPYDFATHSQVYADNPPSLRAIPQAWLFLSGARAGAEGAGAYLPLGAPVELFHSSLVAVFLAALLAVTVLPRRRVPLGLDRIEAVHLLLWAVLPLACLWVASMVWRPCFYPRYVLYSAPAVFLCAGAGYAQVQTPALRRALAILVVLLGGYLALGIPRPFRPDYQSWAREVAQEEQHTQVLALKPYNALAAGYALRVSPEEIQVPGIGSLHLEVLQHTARGTTVWAVFHHWGELEAFAGWLVAQGLHFERRQYGGLPPLFAFRIKASPGPDQDQQGSETAGRPGPGVEDEISTSGS